MREYRFRGKKKSDGQWVYGLLEKHIENTFYIVINNSLGAYQVIPETVGEWTGLQDSERVDIYEDDIIQRKDLNSGYKFLIKWCNSCGFNMAWVIDTFERSSLKIFIIGNAHDNPELLEGQNVKN